MTRWRKESRCYPGFALAFLQSAMTACAKPIARTQAKIPTHAHAHTVHREQRERLRDLDKEITRLKAECNQQLDNTRGNIAKHRSGLLHFREEYDQISGENLIRKCAVLAQQKGLDCGVTNRKEFVEKVVVPRPRRHRTDAPALCAL